MSDLLGAINNTPLPTIFVLAGIFFWLLAIAGTLAGKITVEQAHKRTAGALGTVLIGLGLVIFFFAPTSGPGPTVTSTTPPEQRPAQDSPRTESTSASRIQPIEAAIASSPATQNNPPQKTSERPSFDCETDRKPEEIAICNNGHLSYLDHKMDDLYNELIAGLTKDKRDRLLDEQRAWIRQRRSCRSDVSCLTKTYEARIAQLESWH